MSTTTDRGWFALAPCGLMSTTLDGVIVEANDTLLGWLGYADTDIVGRSFTSLLDAGSHLFYETRHRQVIHVRGRADDVALTMLTAARGPLPMLLNSILDEEAGLVRTALFDATERLDYQRELVQARKSAEASEKRVRILQDVSSALGAAVVDESVAEAFAAIVRDAFTAREAAVFLLDSGGQLVLVGGTDPLAGGITREIAFRNAPDVTVVEDALTSGLPGLSAALRTARLASLSITPLVSGTEQLGIVVCFFGRSRPFDESFADLQQALGREASQALVRVRLQRRLSHLAHHDQLTGVASRPLLQQSLEDGIDAASTCGEPLSVLFVDVDEFKSINDRFGHDVGDMILVELGARLSASVRSGDVVGRIGGDEFVAICAGADSSAVSSIAERLLALTRQPITARGVSISASVSVGVSLYRPARDPRPSGEQMLARADAAMYESKWAGKNRVTLEDAIAQ